MWYPLYFLSRPVVLHFESLVKCQFYALSQNDAVACNFNSAGFLKCIENLKNSSALQNCENYVYEDEFMTEFGIYSGIFPKIDNFWNSFSESGPTEQSKH